METAFTPCSSLAGGALIGLAAVVLMATTGRIAGVSGIVSRLLPPAPDRSSFGEGVAFVVGLALAMPLWTWLVGAPELVLVGSPTTLVVAGLLVGVGSVIGNGCTSGHGVCGLSRLSVRSAAAVATFMATAAATVHVLRHVAGG